MMTLWCIARSPLILGGNLPETDEFTFSLITNPEALSVNQNSSNNHQLYRQGERVAWIADVPDSKDKYIALFNIGDEATNISVTVEQLQITGPFSVRNLWQQSPEGQFAQEFGTELPPHSSGLFRLIID
jgi:alpha-galactosidase